MSHSTCCHRNWYIHMAAGRGHLHIIALTGVIMNAVGLMQSKSPTEDGWLFRRTTEKQSIKGRRDYLLFTLVPGTRTMQVTNNVPAVLILIPWSCILRILWVSDQYQYKSIQTALFNSYIWSDSSMVWHLCQMAFKWFTVYIYCFIYFFFLHITLQFGGARWLSG